MHCGSGGPVTMAEAAEMLGERSGRFDGTFLFPLV